MITVETTNTNKIKFTVTANGDVRVKVNHSVNESEFPFYVALGEEVSRKLGPVSKTHRGNMTLDDKVLILFNDSKKESVRLMMRS